MPDINITDVHTLYALILSTVIFLSVFVLVVNFIPAEAYNPLKNYGGNYQPNDFGAGSVASFSYLANWTIVFGGGDQKVFLNGTEIHYEWFDASHTYSGTNATLFTFYHLYYSYYVFQERESMSSASPPDFDYPSPVELNTASFSPKWLLLHYNNKTDTATFTITCSAITLKLTFFSNSTDYTLPSALQNEQPIRAIVSWNYDFSSMGANIWGLLANILTFQTIKTGLLALDLLLNAVVSIPVWTSVSYIIYRLVTGLIPTLSGGGGA